MNTVRIPDDLHLFKLLGHNIAFNPETYCIAVLDEVGYDLLHDVANPALTASYAGTASRLVCSLSESQFFRHVDEPLGVNGSYAQPCLQALCLIVTSQCNLRCDYCFNDGGRYSFEQRRIMSRSTARKAMDYLLSRCDSSIPCQVSFFGGEPLTQFSLIEDTVEYALLMGSNAGVELLFHVTTNGTLITSEIAHFLHKHGFTVIVSIDGDEKSHNYHRKRVNDNKGSYAAAIQGATCLVDEYGSQDKITIRGTYTHQQKSIFDSFLHLKNCGFRNISLEPCFGRDLDVYAIDDIDLPELSKEYERLADLYAHEQTTNLKTSFFHFDKVIRDLNTSRRTNTPCGAGNGYMAVSPDGGIYPCHRIIDERFRLGNVNDSALNLDNWLSETFSRATTDNRADCRSCWARSICGGSCYANNIDVGLTMHENERVGCAVTRMFIEYAIAALVLQRLGGRQTDLSFEHGTIVHTPDAIRDSIYSMSCPIRASCDSGCQSSCESSCTSGCLMGCTSGCTGGCTTGKR